MTRLIGMKKLRLIGLVSLLFSNLCPAALSSPTDVAFTATSDGTKQCYVLILPAGFNTEQSHDLLIALHGHGSDRWQFARDSRDECRAARDVAAEHGMIYVSPDYRAKTSWMGPKAETDLVQIIEMLKQEYRVSRVFLCGGSMGGTASLTFTALHPELVDGVAAMNGTANLIEHAGFPEAIAASYGGSKAVIPDEYKKRSAEFWPELFTMPVGITTGGKDDIVPPQSVVRLANALKARGGNVLMINREETGHVTNYDDARAVIEFVIQMARAKRAESAPATETTIAVLWGTGEPRGTIEIQNGALLSLAAGDAGTSVLGTNFTCAGEGNHRLELRLRELKLLPGPGASRVTVRNGEHSFTFFVRDVTADYPVYIPEYAVIVTPVADRRNYGAIQAMLRERHGQTRLEQYQSEPEADWDTAAARARTMVLPIRLGVSRDTRMFELEPQHNFQLPEQLKSDRLATRFFGEGGQSFPFMLGRGVNSSETMQRRLDNGVLPILHGTRMQEDVEYRLTAFATLERSPLLAASLRGTDFLVADYQCGGHSRDALTTNQLQRAEALLPEETSPELEQTVLYFRAEARNTAATPQYAYFLAPNPNTALDATRGYFVSGDKVGEIARLDGRPLPNEELSVLLSPGQTATLECRVPHQPISIERAGALAAQSWDQRLEECRRFWTTKLEAGTKLHVPEPRIDEMLRAGLLHLDLICFGREPNEPLAAATGYAPIGTESAPIIQFLDSMGWHAQAARALEYFLAKQHPDGFMQNYKGYQSEVGPVLWSIGEHWRYTRDEAWARSVAARVLKSCDYLIRRREESRELPRGRGRGMIRGKVADPEDPYHSFMLNGYACLGLARVAEMLETIDPPQAARLRREADVFRQEIRESFATTLAESPVVPLRDGSWAPNPAPWVGEAGALILYAAPEQRHFFTHGSPLVRDCLMGPIYLPFTEILTPTETASRWLARVQTEMYGVHNVVPTQPYYSRHDWLQLRQGYVGAFLQTYYQTAASYFDRQTYTVKEHAFGGAVHKTHEEAWFLMQTRWMLWMEDGNRLRLLSGIPRAWLKGGERITIERAASYFGPFSLQVESKNDATVIEAEVEFLTERKPAEILLRLPHPQHRKATRVEGGEYDPVTETVRITAWNGRARVSIHFD